jgi:hypothetical protein
MKASLKEENSAFNASLTEENLIASVTQKTGQFNAFIDEGRRMPIYLLVTGEWAGFCVCGHSVSENIGGLTFKCIYDDGTRVSVTPTYEPTVWQDEEGSQTITFSYTERGTTLIAQKYANVIKVNYVGGIVYYIDSTADGEYEFWDANGNPVDEPVVGTDCTNWTYKVTGATKDKFYIFYDAKYDSNRWCPYINGSYVRESTGFADTSIGSGKVNTLGVMALDDGKYIQESSNGYPTIWYRIAQLNAQKLGGCNDWYIGSKEEVNILSLSHLGHAGQWFINDYFWTSSEGNNVNAWLWYNQNNHWEALNKMNSISICPMRSF